MRKQGKALLPPPILRNMDIFPKLLGFSLTNFPFTLAMGRWWSTMKPRNPGPEGNSTDPRSFINLKLFFGLCIRVAHIPEASVAFCLMEIRKKKNTGSFFEYIFWKTLPTAKCNKHEHWKSSALTLLVSNAATLPCNTPINCHPGCIWKTYRNRIHFGREILFGRKAFDKLGKRDLNNRLTFELWITW